MQSMKSFSLLNQNKTKKTRITGLLLQITDPDFGEEQGEREVWVLGDESWHMELDSEQSVCLCVYLSNNSASLLQIIANGEVREEFCLS